MKDLLLQIDLKDQDHINFKVQTYAPYINNLMFRTNLYFLN